MLSIAIKHKLPRIGFTIKFTEAKQPSSFVLKAIYFP